MSKRFFVVLIFAIFSLTAVADVFSIAASYRENIYKEKATDSDEQLVKDNVSEIIESLKEFSKSEEFIKASKKNREFRETVRILLVHSELLLKILEKGKESSENDFWNVRVDIDNFLDFKEYYDESLQKNTFSSEIVKMILVILSIVIISFGISFLIYKFSMKRQISFSNKIIKAQEDERRKISMELHDTIAQQMKTIQLESRQSKNDKITELSTECIKEIRALCYSLMPPDFNIEHSPKRLQTLLKFLCDDFNKSGKTRCTFTSDDEIPEIIDNEILLNTFRIVQEALNNIKKHSQAETCSVVVRKVLQKKKDSIVIFITDDGIGIDSEILNNGREMHFGLQSMKNRAKTINANLTIESEKNDGTTVKLQL